MTFSTHTKLENGELQVAGDQWPVFLYADYTYDPEDPWNGLLHSGLLVSVSFMVSCFKLINSTNGRRSNISSRPQAL